VVKGQRAANPKFPQNLRKDRIIQTWKIGALPPGRGRAPLGCRWVFKNGKEVYISERFSLFDLEFALSKDNFAIIWSAIPENRFPKNDAWDAVYKSPLICTNRLLDFAESARLRPKPANRTWQ
jgi:hypothetical protein